MKTFDGRSDTHQAETEEQVKYCSPMLAMDSEVENLAKSTVWKNTYSAEATPPATFNYHGCKTEDSPGDGDILMKTSDNEVSVPEPMGEGRNGYLDSNVIT